ncbi:cell division protein ZipA C-terminal FtsZ-binding domain-containing protein [Vreelandella aquamarina]
MDNSLVTVLAVSSFLLGLAAVALLIYMVARNHASKKDKGKKPAVPSSTPAEKRAPAPDAHDEAQKQPPKGSQHSLFVIFSQPSEVTDQRLTEWLKDKNASFDPIKKVFHIDGVQPSSPITIANAFPPGEMPDLLRGDVHQPIRGISLLVKPPLRKRRNQQMIAYVDIAKEISALFDGDMLDADRAPATEATYERIIG